MGDEAGRRLSRWWIALRACWDLTYFWVLVRARPRTLAPWRSQAARSAAPNAVPGTPGADRVVAIVNRVARQHPLRPACLERALAGCAALRRRGIHATVAIGVRRDESGLHAHAWIDAGALTFDPEAERYAVFGAAPVRPAPHSGAG